MKNYVFILGAIFFTVSCSQQDEINSSEKESNYYALKVGNSWVYKYYKYNPETELCDIDTGIMDSVYIKETQDVLASKYFVFRHSVKGNEENNHFYPKNGEKVAYLKELDGDLCNRRGRVMFTNNNYDEVFRSELNDELSLYSKLQVGSYEITTAAGTFSSLKSHSYAKNKNGEISEGKDQTIYVEGVGLVFSSCSNISGHGIIYEKRLFSYAIQK